MKGNHMRRNSGANISSNNHGSRCPNPKSTMAGSIWNVGPSSHRVRVHQNFDHMKLEDPGDPGITGI